MNLDFYEKTINMMIHAIGLDYAKAKTYKGKKYYYPYRNYYDAGGDDVFCWEELCARGLAERKGVYKLTLQGLEALSKVTGIIIYNPMARYGADAMKEVFRFYCKKDNEVCYGCWFPVSAVSAAAQLRMPLSKVRKAIKDLVGIGYLIRSHSGGQYDGGVYCFHGYDCTPKARETDVWKKCYKDACDEIDAMLRGE